jgi:endonuclease/exonuclease/phosphatase family metal-dependent hydrolase
MSVKIKVMTFNLRVPSKVDENNHFKFRQDRVIELIQKESPDIIGFQEAVDYSFDFLKERLSNYYILGCGRDDRYHGEGAPIAFRKDVFSLCGFRQEWLSLTPRKPATRLEGLDQSGCPRVFSCAELIHRDCDKPIAFYNVHSDHRGELAKVVESTILMRDIASSPYQFILTGDFNAQPDSTSITMIKATNTSLGTVDLTELIPNSFHGFDREGLVPVKIDYIFSNLPGDPSESYAVPAHLFEGHYSDHNALCAFVEI